MVKVYYFLLDGEETIAIQIYQTELHVFAEGQKHQFFKVQAKETLERIASKIFFYGDIPSVEVSESDLKETGIKTLLTQLDRNSLPIQKESPSLTKLLTTIIKRTGLSGKAITTDDDE